MEEKLNLIIIQNWILLALFSYIAVASLVINFLAMRKHFSKQPKLKDLWETDQLDRLLGITEAILNKAPLDEMALYYRARALYKTEKIEAALLCHKRLMTVNPTLATACKYISDSEKELLPLRRTESVNSTH